MNRTAGTCCLPLTVICKVTFSSVTWPCWSSCQGATVSMASPPCAANCLSSSFQCATSALKVSNISFASGDSDASSQPIYVPVKESTVHDALGSLSNGTSSTLPSPSPGTHSNTSSLVAVS